MNIARVFFLVYFSISSLAFGSAQSCVFFYEKYPAGLAFKKSLKPEHSKNRVSVQRAKQLKNYLDRTIQGFETMRGRNGLVKDTMWLPAGKKPQGIVSFTSGTNIAIDLLIQTELLSQGRNSAKSYQSVSKILKTLKALPIHEDSGLFFSWYGTQSSSFVANRDISSIDNLHLAIALWTVSETFPKSTIGKQARSLFNSMDFSIFYDEKSGFIGGNFSYLNGHWYRNEYNFSYLGSEARILYTAGWALGLFKKYNDRDDLINKAIHSLYSETIASKAGPLLKLWDGSAFQLYFPKIFVGEETFSPTLKKIYSSSAEYMISEGKRRQLPVPAAHSPGVRQIVEITNSTAYSIYNDKAGNKNLVSSMNADLRDPQMEKHWDRTYTPYALFMAGTTNPEKFLPIIERTENFNHSGVKLFNPEYGWMDGLVLSGENSGNVVPAQLAVNNGMIALSLMQMQSADGLSVSGRAFKKNAPVKQRMQLYYQMIENKLNPWSNQ